MDKLRQDLNPKQKEAVEYTQGPLLVLAGAGSGKTRVITYRVAYFISKGVTPWNILAVTFTNKAAEEMRTRVEKLLHKSLTGIGTFTPLICTFHSFCVRVLRQDIDTIGGDRHFIIYDKEDQLKIIKECLKELKVDDKKYKPSSVLEVIDRAKDDLLDVESYQIYAGAKNDYIRQQIAEIWRLYQEKLTRNKALDFGDLINKTVQLWQEHKDILNKHQERFKYIMIDEYQDTNYAQYVLAKLLASKYKNICVVGDEDQGIYMFRGADIRNILNFGKDYPDYKIIKLEQNYRSTKNILERAHKVISYNMYRQEKELWTHNQHGLPVQFVQLNNEIEEANFVVQQIKHLIKSEDLLPKEIAVFYRTNAQSRTLEDACRKANLKYNIVGTVRFYERKEIKDVLAYLRVVVNPHDSLNLKRIINEPNRGLGKTTCDYIDEYAQDKRLSFYEALGKHAKIKNFSPRIHTIIDNFLKTLHYFIQNKNKLIPSQLASEIIEKTGILKQYRALDTSEAQGRIENIRELVSGLKEFEENNLEMPGAQRSLETFLEQVALISDIDTWEEKQNLITLMTLHLAKGLEFTSVFITGAEEGLLPHINSLNSQVELEEERRLCYVGMTRAKKILYITCAAERRLYGNRRWSIPSRFITEAELIEANTINSPNDPPISSGGHSTSADRQIADSSIPAPTLVGSGQGCRMPDRSEKEQKLPARFRIGDRVEHEEFGEGIIIETNGTKEDLKVIVQFNSGQRKKLLVKLANLKKI